MPPSRDPAAVGVAASQRLAAAMLAKADLFADLTLEKLLCDPRLGQFTPSPVQRALIRAADGVPFELPKDDRLFHFNAERLPSGRPRLVILRTGVRAGKSLIAALALLLSVLTCHFRRLPDPSQGEIPDADGLIGVRPGEFVRAVIVAPKLKLARSPLSHLIGTMQASPALAKLLVKVNVESITVRRPDGREVMIELVAADTGGAGLRSTWLAGALFDEADFHDDEDAAVNLPEQIRAARTRLLPDAQMWIPSSPWTDAGPFHEMFTAAFGKPLENETLAFHSNSRAMNPALSRADEDAERKRDPENAAREYDAIPLPAGTARFFPEDAIAKSVASGRTGNLPPLAVLHYAGVDWGFTKNSSALAIARPEDGKVRLAYSHEKRPERMPDGKPGESLKPREVVKDFATTSMFYGCRTMRGDKYLDFIRSDERAEFIDSLTDAAHKARVPTFEDFNPSRDEVYNVFAEFRRRMQEGLIDLPKDERLLAQLRSTTSRPMPGGSTKIVLPKQGHAHGDLLMAVVLACVAAPVVAASTAPRRPRPTRSIRGYGDENESRGLRGYAS